MRCTASMRAGATLTGLEIYLLRLRSHRSGPGHAKIQQQSSNGESYTREGISSLKAGWCTSSIPVCGATYGTTFLTHIAAMESDSLCTRMRS
jgi:hypothetical protein